MAINASSINPISIKLFSFSFSYTCKNAQTMSAILSLSHSFLWITGAVRISSIAFGTSTFPMRDSSSTSAKSSIASYFSSIAFITLLVNLKGLAVDAITVFVRSFVSSLYLS